MPLPTAPTTNDLNPERLRAIITGVPGVGKTSLAAGWYPASNLIIDLQGGTRFLPGQHFVERVESFSAFCATVNELVAGGHQFRTVTIDTIDRLVRMADSEAGQRNGKSAAALVEYGKGLADRDAVVLRELRKLLNTDLGVILVAHPFDRDVKIGENPDGSDATVTKVFPRIDPNDRITQEVIGDFDFLIALKKDRHDVRTIVTGGDPAHETKRRVPMADVIAAPDADEGAKALYAAVAAGCTELSA